MPAPSREKPLDRRRRELRDLNPFRRHPSAHLPEPPHVPLRRTAGMPLLGQVTAKPSTDGSSGPSTGTRVDPAITLLSSDCTRREPRSSTEICCAKPGLKPQTAIRPQANHAAFRRSPIAARSSGRHEQHSSWRNIRRDMLRATWRGRPSSSRRREVFLRALAPIGPLRRGGVSAIVRRACRRAGVTAVGSHRLRHMAACEMVSARVPLAQVGQVLGHRSLQSTAIYARVDLDQLRLLAQPWPGSEQR